MKKWNNDIDKFIRSQCPCESKKELLETVNKKFNTCFTYNALQSHINVDLQATYPGINLVFVESDYDIVDLTSCPL